MAEDNRVTLQTGSLPDTAGGYDPFAPPGGFTPSNRESSDLFEYLRLVRRRRGMLLVFAFLGALCGLAWRVPETPRYEAVSTIELQAMNQDFLYSKDISPNSNSGGSNTETDLLTQVKVLETDLLLNRVIRKLMGDQNATARVPADRLAAWRKILHIPAPVTGDREAMIRATASTIHVKLSPSTRVIQIYCDSASPELAARFANTVATEYVDLMLESRWQSTQHTAEWLTRQMDEMKVKLERSEDELQHYATSANLVLTGDKDKANMTDEKLRQVQAELSHVQAERATLQARSELALTGKGDALALVMDDSTLRDYDRKHTDLLRELAELSSTLTPEHYKVRKVQAQLAELETQQRRTRETIGRRIQSDYQEVQRREALLSMEYQKQTSVVSDQNGKTIHYNILQREVETNRGLYESLLQKVKEASISAALRSTNVQLIDPAAASTEPVSPNLKRSASIGMILGLLGGIGLVLLREKVNRTIDLPGDAAMYLRVPELGTIPSSSLDNSKTHGLRNLASYVRTGRREVALAAWQNGQSLVAEAFRVTLTSILFVARRQRLQVLLVGSPGPAEGKTTVLANLAACWAEINRSVLVIDGDLRRPRLHRIFDVPNEAGLAELLRQRDPLTPHTLFEATQPSRVAGVSVLTSGEAGKGIPNLLHSPRLPELIALARKSFDIILIDSPPILHISDSRVIGSMTDGVVMVVRCGKTSRDAAVAAKRQLSEDGIPVIGVALNDWNPRITGYYRYESYRNYYSSYYQKTTGKEE